MNYKDIDSHETAAKVLGKDPKESTNIQDKLDDIADAINKLDGDFIADFKDKNQQKWRPYFIIDDSGFRFHYSYYDRSDSSAFVGSRLCQYFRSEEAADYFGKTFFQLHEKCFFKVRPKTGTPKHFKEIDSHASACLVLEKEPSLSKTADQMLKDIADAMNSLTGFKADFKNGDQQKWRPFFLVDDSGFRFYDSRYGSSGSSADVGSRLCDYVSSKEEAEHFGQHFVELHKKRFYGE